MPLHHRAGRTARPRIAALAATFAAAFTSTIAVGALVAACTGGAPTAAPTSPAPSTPSAATPTPEASPTPTPTADADPLAGWTLEQKVGRVVMVGLPLDGDEATTLRLLGERHVGSLFLHGRSHEPVEQIRALTDTLHAAAPATGVPLLVATDQEGGLVQVLQGPGFTEMPRATAQATLPDLLTQATTWGGELAAAGVTVNLAPVADLVDVADPANNPPIGYFGRNYGTTPDAAATGATAFAQGLQSAGVIPTIKHFPGLGRVTENTDTTAGVTDTVTTADDAAVGVFRDVIAAAEAGAGPRPWVMTSTAVYAQIDPSLPAAFSPTVVGLLRDTLGFDGVVITDDLSAAKQVAAWSPGDRAVLTIEAGGDVVLASADPSVADEMLDALIARAQADPAFAAKIDTAAHRVVAAALATDPARG